MYKTKQAAHQILRIFFLLILAICVGCGKKEEEKPTATLKPVSVGVVQKDTIADSFDVTGTVVPLQDISITPEVSGVIVEKLVDEGVQLVSMEQTFSSTSIYDMDWKFPVCFVVGNEVTGVSDEMIQLSHASAEIPMSGVKQSLNVSVAAGIIGYEISRKYYQHINRKF